MPTYACKDHWAALVAALLETYGMASVVEVVPSFRCEYQDCGAPAYVEVMR